MTTLKNLINTSMRKVGIIAAGDEASPDEFQDVLAELRRMVDTWRLENLMIYVNAIRTFDLAPAASSYAYGEGAAFDAPRPIKIMAATLKDGAGLSFPLAELTSIEFSELQNRGTIARPTAFYYAASYPIATLFFDRIPDDPLVELVVQEPLTLPDTLVGELALPPGYEDCLIYNLAVRICPDFGKSASQEVLGLATSFKSLIKRANVAVPLQQFEHGVRTLPGTYDIHAGPVR